LVTEGSYIICFDKELEEVKSKDQVLMKLQKK
jgi:hypothetical protein